METMTQPKLTGYRQLNEAEAAMMNDITAIGAELQTTVNLVRDYLTRQAQRASEDHDIEELRRIGAAESQRWVSMARTHFQEGLMDLRRAVAQPNGMF
jgi:hypothetical protein